MKKFKIQNASGAVLWILLAVSVIVFAMFYFGGEASADEHITLGVDTTIAMPAQTDTLIFWMYALVLITIAVTIIAAIFQYGALLKDSPKAAIKSLLGVIVLIALMAGTYAMGDNTPLTLVGYTGSENQAPWLAVGDMFAYTIYVEIGVLVVLMIAFGIRNRLKL
jgi:hypothetical protein